MRADVEAAACFHATRLWVYNDEAGADSPHSLGADPAVDGTALLPWLSCWPSTVTDVAGLQEQFIALVLFIVRLFTI